MVLVAVEGKGEEEVLEEEGASGDPCYQQRRHPSWSQGGNSALQRVVAGVDEAVAGVAHSYLSCSYSSCSGQEVEGAGRASCSSHKGEVEGGPSPHLLLLCGEVGAAAVAAAESALRRTSNVVAVEVACVAEEANPGC